MHSISPQHLTWIARALGLVMLVLAIFAVYVVTTCYEPPVDPYTLASLYEGATKDEVTSALGPPTSIEDDGRRWLYTRFMKVRVAQVVFDDEGLLLSRGFTDEEPSFTDEPQPMTDGEAVYETAGDGAAESAAGELEY